MSSLKLSMISVTYRSGFGVGNMRTSIIEKMKSKKKEDEVGYLISHLIFLQIHFGFAYLLQTHNLIFVYES